MKRLILFTLSLIALSAQPADIMAQGKDLVVVMNRNYTYEDPRWNQSVTLKQGEAITVVDDGSANYDYWPYPAANVVIPKKVTRLAGTKGEHYIIINGTNVRFREGPSTRYGYYCYNAENTASVYHNQFIHDNNKPKTDDFGLAARWEPYYLPKGTRLPYLGQQNGFYKTKFNNNIFYISAKYCIRK